MNQSSAGDTVEDLWSEIGLQELRSALGRINGLAQDFEHALRLLPPCRSCARAALLEPIRTTGSQLSGAVIGLAALAQTLRQTMKTVEETRGQLAADAPAPCRCPSGPCTCRH